MRSTLSQTPSPIVADLARYGAWAAIVLIVLTIAWIVTLALAPAPAPDAPASEHLRFLGAHDGWQIASFGVVVPLGLVHVPVWTGLAAVIWIVRPALSVLTVAFGLLYAPFTIIGYWNQLTTVRGLVELYEQEPERAATAFEVIGFTGDQWSASYGVVVLGYGIWGLAALGVFGGLYDSSIRLARVTAVLFGISGVLAIIGATGFVARSTLLEFGVLASGIVFLPALIGTAVLLSQFSAGTFETSKDR